MFTEIGAFDAKTKLSRLLRGVKQGQRYTITLRGVPIADLVPSESLASSDVQAAVEAMRCIRKVKKVASEQVAAWIAEGRL